jgi:hypothetical protein
MAPPNLPKRKAYKDEAKKAIVVANSNFERTDSQFQRENTVINEITQLSLKESIRNKSKSRLRTSKSNSRLSQSSASQPSIMKIN